jgi:PelA/Pel-15E family pectate lyase
MHARWMLAVVGMLFASSPLHAAEELSAKDATAALHKAVAYFRRHVSASGGYLWRYSADLKLQEGENAAGPTTAWVQPPGTPTVGDAYLTAYELTGDRELLAASRETALALVKGQLQSGGWDYRIEFDARQRRRYAYRVDGPGAGKRNVTTLDDDTTQSALRFLMRVDRALEFKDKPIHDAATYALKSLLKAQYPNGAWPQRYSAFPKVADYPVKKASYPASWSRTYRKKDYRGYYTFNDNSIADVIDTLFLATEISKDKRYRQAAEKAGDFIILAQMPDPQPAWAQQYDRNMHPAWARKFEPPAVTGGESQGVLRTLLSLYRRTGKKKYLAPVPRALAYLKKSRLPGGRLARFYELKTNRPLYFVKDTYELTYRDDNLPTHYAFKVGSRLARIERDYQRLLKTDPSHLNPPPRKPVYRLSRSLRDQARQLVAALDDRGAWVEPGGLRKAGRANRIISTRTFTKNVETLARFIAASKMEK